MGINTGVRQGVDGLRKTAFAAAILLVGLIAMFCCQSASAVTPISQSYKAEGTIPQGAIVSLKTNTADQVAAATSENADNIFGITINEASSLLSISGGGGTQVQVATSGTVPVLVSDINGAIKQGDPITASPIAGVGMKATDNIRIIGLAQSDMSGSKKQTYKEKSGAERSVNVGQVPVLVNVSYFFKQPDKTLIPSALQNIANGIAGKKVDSLPIIISAAIFIIMLIVVVSIVYSMIKSSIISVGRNPMSQGAVYRDLVQMSALVFGILGVGLVAIYLILTRL